MEPLIPDSISDSDERRVSRYVDGALEGEELAAFEAQLREREELRRLVDRVAAVDASVSKALAATLSSAGGARGSSWSEPADRRAGPARLLAVAALALLALGLWAAFSSGDRSSVTREPGADSSGELVALDSQSASAKTSGGTAAVAGGEGLEESQDEWEFHEPVRLAPGAGLLDVPDERSRTMDHAVPAAYLPAVSGPSQGTYLEESNVITVFDREENRLYLFELKHARATIRPARIDL